MAEDLWWERAGQGRPGPGAPGGPWQRRAAPLLAAAVGLSVLAATVGAVEGSRSDAAGQGRVGEPTLAGIAAGCEPPTEWEVDPGEVGIVLPSASDQGTRVAYRTVPASFGRYLADPAPPRPAAYLPGQSYPIVERLVNNMRRGYTVVFYGPGADRASVDAVAAWAAEQSKVLLVPWDPTRPPLPDGSTAGIATWGVTQLCDRLDSDTVAAFRDRYPPSRAPAGGRP